MRAIVFDQPGDESVLHMGEVDPPPLVSGAIRIGVSHHCGQSRRSLAAAGTLSSASRRFPNPRHGMRR